MEQLHAFDALMKVEHLTLPMILPTVMVVVVPPFFPLLIPVPTVVALPVPVLQLGVTDQSVKPDPNRIPIPVEIVTEHA